MFSTLSPYKTKEQLVTADAFFDEVYTSRALICLTAMGIHWPRSNRAATVHTPLIAQTLFAGESTIEGSGIEKVTMFNQTVRSVSYMAANSIRNWN